MKKIGSIVAFEAKRMLWAKTTAIYAGIYLINFAISAIFFKLYGSEYTVLTEGNAQSFPVQHLQASYLFTGIFLAIYVAQIIVQERSQGTIKLLLLRPVSRSAYYISRVISIFLFSVLLTLIMIVLSYVVGLLFLGWGDQLVWGSLTSGGIHGVVLTFWCGLAFAVSYFAFGMVSMVVSMFTNKLLESAIIMGVLLMAGQYFELLPGVKQFAVFHQMLFFHMDVFEKPFAYSAVSILVLAAYCIVFGLTGYLAFRRKDLYV